MAHCNVSVEFVIPGASHRMTTLSPMTLAMAESIFPDRGYGFRTLNHTPATLTSSSSRDDELT